MKRSKDNRRYSIKKELSLETVFKGREEEKKKMVEKRNFPTACWVLGERWGKKL